MAALKDRILAEIDAEGPMPVARFVELALYDPEDGYYADERARAGEEWVTGPTLHPIFGQALARGLAPLLAQVDDPALVDAGAGGGELARDVALALREEAPDVFEALTIHLVDATEPALARARDTLEAAGIPLDDVHASTTLPEGVTGAIVANELVDATPVHLCRAAEDGVEEIHVVPGEPTLGLAAGEPSTERVARYARDVARRAGAGQLFEVPLAGLDWTREAARSLDEGALVVVDYGATEPELLDAYPKGTLHAYRHGQRVDEFWLDPGEMDITYRVPFDRVAAVGEGEGLTTEVYAPQGDALDALGIRELARGDARDTLAAKKLIDPGGAGGTFKVLAQTRAARMPDAWPRGT